MIILCGFKKTEQQKVIKKKTKPPPREPLPTEPLLQAPPNRHWPTLAVVPESQPARSDRSTHLQHYSHHCSPPQSRFIGHLQNHRVVRFRIIRSQIRNRLIQLRHHLRLPSNPLQPPQTFGTSTQLR
ncbi:unnamed protein product [Vicia faba]|uniref:Uncharacterized protein n=1 Tax=Vicia faba TaxID=3906 RepID=A0AAV1B3B1_VICFA|nr:unnamed protein product [Vicia faba]